MEEGWHELDESKEKGNFQNSKATSPKTQPLHICFHPFLGFAPPHGEVSPSHHEETSQPLLNGKWQHLTCPTCPSTWHFNLPSHKIQFRQVSFNFLIAEFFKYLNVFGLFWVFRVIINFGVK